jgi:hypothetical protein
MPQASQPQKNKIMAKNSKAKKAAPKKSPAKKKQPSVACCFS